MVASQQSLCVDARFRSSFRTQKRSKEKTFDPFYTTTVVALMRTRTMGWKCSIKWGRKVQPTQGLATIDNKSGMEWKEQQGEVMGVKRERERRNRSSRNECVP
jgi:hypothetical protein